ncbi:replication protein A 70 kDa DNA-binding subunit-like [Neosynchiropus ocellatus]
MSAVIAVLLRRVAGCSSDPGHCSGSQALLSDSTVNSPVLQLLNIRQIGSDKGPPRFRLKMSDGVHSYACSKGVMCLRSAFLLATQLNSLPEEGALAPLSVCMLKRSVSNTLADGRRVLTIIDMEVIASAADSGGQVGDPIPFRPGLASSSPTSSPSMTSSPSCDAAPGPSGSLTSTAYRGQGRGLGGMSPVKASPVKASPVKASPVKASPVKASPVKASPVKASPAKFSPMKAGSPAARPTVIPISALHPYISKWTLRARVTHRSDIRNWSNSRGDGKLFSFEIVDESGEIRVTAFNKEVDRFFSLVEQGKVYYISNGTLKAANQQYTTVKNDFEITLHASSSIVLCDDGQRIPLVHCDFVTIAELDNRDKDALVDVIGLCRSADDVSLITTRAGREVSKRALHLVDMSGKEVTATIWGDEAVKFDGSGQPVVAIKGARLSDFGGRSLSASFNSTLMVNPDIPEAFGLRAWYDREGHALRSQSLTQTRSPGRGLTTNWKTLSDIKTEQMGHTEKADYFSCVATVAYIRKENCLYRACPSADCNKKVTERGAGLWRCDKCDREFPTFKYRLLLSVNLSDYGDQQWVTCFQDTAEVLLGQSAESLGRLRDTDEAAFDEVFRRVSLTSHIFKNRVKLETYNDECRVKVTVLEVLPVDHREYSRRLIRNIRKLAV